MDCRLYFTTPYPEQFDRSSNLLFSAKSDGPEDWESFTLDFPIEESYGPEYTQDRFTLTYTLDLIDDTIPPFYFTLNVTPEKQEDGSWVFNVTYGDREYVVKYDASGKVTPVRIPVETTTGEAGLLSVEITLTSPDGFWPAPGLYVLAFSVLRAPSEVAYRLNVLNKLQNYYSSTAYCLGPVFGNRKLFGDRFFAGNRYADGDQTLDMHFRKTPESVLEKIKFEMQTPIENDNSGFTFIVDGQEIGFFDALLGQEGNPVIAKQFGPNEDLTLDIFFLPQDELDTENCAKVWDVTLNIRES